jgi:hypothetical protein
MTMMSLKTVKLLRMRILCYDARVLIVIEILEFTLLYSVEQDRDFIGMELADHFSLFPSILALHSLKLFNNEPIIE